MFVAAVIPFDPEEHVFTLEDLLDHLLANLSFQCALTEWRGFSDAVPQLRVETTVPLTIQIEDDPDIVPDEIEDLADRAGKALSEDWVEAVRQCTARLDVQEADSGPTPRGAGAASAHGEQERPQRGRGGSTGGAVPGRRAVRGGSQGRMGEQEVRSR